MKPYKCTDLIFVAVSQQIPSKHNYELFNKASKASND